MTGLRRPLLSLLALSLLSLASTAQVQDTFNEGVTQLAQGNNEAALQLFQQVLAQDPSHEDAYELWQSTSHDIWMKMLVLEGEYEIVAKRFMDLASLGRKERANDPDAIRGLLGELVTNDVAVRTRVTRQLAAEHGEYAVPLMVNMLADRDNDDRRVIMMQVLTQMGDDVVLPLIEALDSSDAYLKRNAALTLGYISDPRASGGLAHLAATDSDQTVRDAASQALERCGGSADAGAIYLALGDGYYSESDAVLMPHQVSDVVWNWEGEALVSTPIPASLYAPEMAKRQYYRALYGNPGSMPALAGVARCAVTQRSRVNELAAAGQDVGDWSERLNSDDLAVRLAGADALDLALGFALETNDQVAAAGIIQTLGTSSTSATPNLQRALAANRSGAVRGEAAVALGTIASANTSGVDSDTVIALAEAASRQVLQIAVIIDSDDARRESNTAALAGDGLMVNAWPTGARALAALRQVPGVDVILIADTLSDMARGAVIDEIRSDPAKASTPIIVVSSDAEAEEGQYGDEVTAVIPAGSDLSAVSEALSGGVDSDRAQANALAARAAETLHSLTLAGGTDVSPAANALASTLASRPDEVVGPALGALASVGSSAHVLSIAAVLVDAERSEEIRIMAANALAGIFSRSGTADAETIDALGMIATTEASMSLRNATANALGRLSLTDSQRVTLIRGVQNPQ